MPRYTKDASKQFYIARRPRQIAKLLVRICESNDDRVSQALWNALAVAHGGKVLDFFHIEDKELLQILKDYAKISKVK